MKAASLNHSYRLVWSDVLQAFVAVVEFARSRGKTSGGRTLLASALLLSGVASAAPGANELPTGGSVVGGGATISTSGSRMDVLQTTQKTAIDWNTFNIGSAAQVHFSQPSGGAALNRVLDTNASQIYGKLTSTGQVFLVNPNGVLFAPGAQVDVGGLVASTLNISNADFMAGNLSFAGSSSGLIINQGNIKVGAGGTAALIAAQIVNTGSIEAPQGNVLMGAGNKVTLDLGGAVKLVVEQGAIDALVEQGGAIKADGGLVYLTAKAAGSLTARVINTGVIEASSLTEIGGKVVLLGDQITNTGNIEANGAMGGGEILLGGDWQGTNAELYPHATQVTLGSNSILSASATQHGDGGKIVVWSDIQNVQSETQVAGILRAEGRGANSLGGKVETSGHQLSVAKSTQVETAGGEWLLDPVDITIDNALASTISTALNSSSVTVTTAGNNTPSTVSGESGTVGDITVNAPITKASGTRTRLTLAADRDISINADISGSNGSPLDITLASRYNGGALGGVYIGGNLKSFGGDITIGGGNINATDFAITHSSTPYGDNKAGVFVDQSIIDATIDGSGTTDTTLPSAGTGGNIAIRGKGDLVNGHQFNNGVYFYIGKTIGVVTGGDGSIYIEGYGGKANAHFWDVAAVGIDWESAQTYIKAKNGNVTLKGYAGTVADRYGISSGDTFIGTGGYINIEGDSYMLRNGTLTMNVGGSGDIKAPLLGVGTYSVIKSGSGLLNLAGDAQDWHNNLPSSTTDTSTTGTFTDATLNEVNIVTTSTSTNGALYAFSARPSNINLVANSSATPLTTFIAYTLSDIYNGYTYNGSSQLPSQWSASSIFGNSYSSWVLGTDYNLSYNGTVTSGFSNAGTYSNISVNILRNGFSAASLGNTNGTFRIAQRSITVTANNQSKIYGNADPSLTYQVTSGSLVGSDSLSGVLTRVVGENAGTYTINASALANGNYLITANNGTLTINQRPITVTADNQSKIYGNADPSLTYQVTSGSLVGSDSLRGVLTRVAGENAGTYTINASALANGNYLITANNGTLTINQRPITVTADNQSKIYGNADPSLTYQVTSGSLVGSDTLGVLSRTAGENAGTYTINASALANGNYLITANNGTLTILPAPANPMSAPTMPSFDSLFSIFDNLYALAKQIPIINIQPYSGGDPQNGAGAGGNQKTTETKEDVVAKPETTTVAESPKVSGGESKTTVQSLIKEGKSLKEILDHGFSLNDILYEAGPIGGGDWSKISRLHELGFNAREIKELGFDLEKIAQVVGCAELRKDGFSLREVWNIPEMPRIFGIGLHTFGWEDYVKAGYTPADVKEGGWPISTALNAGFKLSDFKGSRYTAEELKSAGFGGLKELVKAGWTAADLKGTGFPKNDLAKYGWKLNDLKKAGWTAMDLYKSGFSFSELKEAGYGLAELIKGGFGVPELKNAGYGVADFKAAGLGLVDLKKGGYGVAELKMAGYSLSDLKSAGFKDSELKGAGFSVSDMKNIGYSLSDLKNAGYSIAELKNGGFGVDDLRGAGFSIANLGDAGFTKLELSNAGLSAAALRAGGWNAWQFRGAGFSAAEAKSVGIPVFPEGFQAYGLEFF